jgi:two-component system phosphate regulon sensor histidine kinase PhoR
MTLPDSLPPVWADTDRLRQVVQNLLINASKFTPEGGKITLKAKERDGSLVVEVQDNGPGIPEKDQKRLFQPYNRQLGDREHLSGLGLGLALCKYLVELHDGEIWLNSRVGKGSIFGFSIPLATSIQQQVSTEEEAINESASY